MAKKIILMDLLYLIGPYSDEIPVTVKNKQEVVCWAKSLRWLLSHGMPNELEARVKEITAGKDEITIWIQPKDYSSKI